MPTFLLHATSDDDRNPSGWDSVIVSAPSEGEARARAADNAPVNTRVHATWASQRLPEHEEDAVLWMQGRVAPCTATERIATHRAARRIERREARKTGRGPA